MHMYAKSAVSNCDLTICESTKIYEPGAFVFKKNVNDISWSE